MKTKQLNIQKEKDFYTAINEAISRMPDRKKALEAIIGEFEKYKTFFEKTLVQDPKDTEWVGTFRVTYKDKKDVWREFEMIGSQTLESLAEAIVDSMQWSNDHLHSFFWPEKQGRVTRDCYTLFEIGSYGVENDQYPILHTNHVPVSAVDFSKVKKLTFVFDFGEDHQFTVEHVKKRKRKEYEVFDEFPKLVDIRGVAPEQYPMFDE